MSQPPIAWSIAGSDAGGGAGIQADVKTFHGLGVHPCTAITAITAQNTVGVHAVRRPGPTALREQLDALADDLPPAAVKIGMVPDRDSARVIAERLAATDAPVVLDPVLVSTSGSALSDDPAGEPAWMLVPHATIVTPNLHEAAAMLGHPVRGEAAVERAAAAFLERGCRAVVIKGGHGDGPLCMDYVHDGEAGAWLSLPRIATDNTHGTGCTQSSAIAAALAHGYPLLDAVVIARMVVNRAIRESLSIGAGPGPVRQGPWPDDPVDLPWLTGDAQAARQRPRFPSPGDTPIGLYPCVETADWVARLAGEGVDSIQLRNKTLAGEALEREIAAAVGIANRHRVRLFINDHWQSAIRHGAYGVHLGQEDLDDADVGAIERAGLRLGVSTHCYREVARAHALRPSYIACGPIYETKIKVMAFAPQGLEALRRWRRILADYPLVAIGGIDAGRVGPVLATGADGVSLIRAITHAPDWAAATRDLLARMTAAGARRAGYQ